MYLLSDELNSIFVLHPALYQSQSNQHRSPICMNKQGYICEADVCVKITLLYVMHICIFKLCSKYGLELHPVASTVLVSCLGIFTSKADLVCNYL